MLEEEAKASKDVPIIGIGGIAPFFAVSVLVENQLLTAILLEFLIFGTNLYTTCLTQATLMSYF